MPRRGGGGGRSRSGGGARFTPPPRPAGMFMRGPRTPRHGSMFGSSPSRGAAATASPYRGGNTTNNPTATGPFGGGLGRTLAHGAAFGAGSAMAHSLIGGRHYGRGDMGSGDGYEQPVARPYGSEYELY